MQSCCFTKSPMFATNKDLDVNSSCQTPFELTSWLRWCLTIKPFRLQQQSDILSPIYAQIKSFNVNKAGPQAKNIKNKTTWSEPQVYSSL